MDKDEVITSMFDAYTTQVNLLMDIIYEYDKRRAINLQCALNVKKLHDMKIWGMNA